MFEKRVQREKGGRVVTEDPLANRQIEQTLEESGKFSNFSLARRIILEKQEKVNVCENSLFLYFKISPRFLTWHNGTCSE